MGRFLLVIPRGFVLCLLCFGLAGPVAAQQATLDDILGALYGYNSQSIADNQLSIGFDANNTLNDIWSKLNTLRSDLTYRHIIRASHEGAVEQSLGDIMSSLEMFRYQYLQAQNRIEDHEDYVEGALSGTLNEVVTFHDDVLFGLYTLDEDLWHVIDSLYSWSSFNGSIADDVAFIADLDYRVMYQGDTLISDPYSDDTPPGLSADPPDDEAAISDVPAPPVIDDITAIYTAGEEAVQESVSEVSDAEEAFSDAAESALEDIGNEVGNFNSVFSVAYTLPTIVGLGKPIQLLLEVDFAGSEFSTFRSACKGLFSALWLFSYVIAVWLYARNQIGKMMDN